MALVLTTVVAHSTRYVQSASWLRASRLSGGLDFSMVCLLFLHKQGNQVGISALSLLNHMLSPKFPRLPKPRFYI